MKYYTFIYILLLSLLSCSNQEEASSIPQDKPNIILFLVDDMGWQDTSVPFWTEVTPFNQRYHTPNMERLATEGMKFTQAYATPVCSPTRISLMSGMNAARHRVTNWTLRKDQLQPMEVNHPTLSFPRWNVNGITADSSIELAAYATPFPQLLQKAGYHTIHVGKAHLGSIGTPAEDPINLGFDVNIAGHAAGGPGSYLGNNNFSAKWRGGAEVWDIPGLSKYHGTDIFLTEALTIEAIEALEVADSLKKPFYLYMSHYAVHTPLEKDDRYFQKYIDMGLDTTEATYSALVEGMDKSLGDLMNYLDKKGIADNTIILFMSDNGGLSAVARGGERHTHNKPLSSGKGSVHEGGIREPMIVKWPGKVAPNSTNPNYLIIEDFYPTILEMAGVTDYQTVQKVDGKSFLPFLMNTDSIAQDRSLYWHYPNEWGPKGPGIGAMSAIRKGDWKLIYYHVDSSFELFNLAQDIGETQNLFDAEPEKLTELANQLGDYLRDAGAQMPSIKVTGEQVGYPDEVLL